MSIQQTVKIFNSLMQRPFSRLDLAQHSSATPKFVGKVLQEMKTQKMIYVVAYSSHVDGRNRVKIYALGDGEDAKPKLSQSQEERSRRSHARKLIAKRQLVVKTTFVGGKGLWQ